MITVHPCQALSGELHVPGDKSISHRALMLAALATGETQVNGFLASSDCLATLNILRQLGVVIKTDSPTTLSINGVGLQGLKAAAKPLECGNSGTSMRLLTGILAGQTFVSRLTGDTSLSTRPMRRVIEPLQRMGARIQGQGGCAPLTIRGRSPLQAIDYELPVASAQVKSAILLAGLFAEGQTQVVEPVPTRDHTERMLTTFGYTVERSDNAIRLHGGGHLQATTLQIPCDLSSAAFFMVAAAMTPGSDILLRNIGVNPSRSGVIDILRLMGADIVLHKQRQWGGEPVADIHVAGKQLQGIVIPPQWVPLAIDECPIILVAAALARGETVLRGAAELRVKESDRLAAMAEGLKALGIAATLFPDGMRVSGGSPQGGEINSHGDHRIAMSFAMLANCASNVVTIHDTATIATSFPDFVETARQSGMQIENKA